MGAVILTTAAKNAALNALTALLNVGAGTAKIQISSTLDDYVGVELLAEIDLPADVFGDASAGSASLLGTPLSDTDANNSGTAAYCRFIDRDGTEVFKGTVTATAGGGLIELDDVDIIQNGTVTVTGGTLSFA